MSWHIFDQVRAPKITPLGPRWGVPLLRDVFGRISAIQRVIIASGSIRSNRADRRWSQSIRVHAGGFKASCPKEDALRPFLEWVNQRDYTLVRWERRSAQPAVFRFSSVAVAFNLPSTVDLGLEDGIGPLSRTPPALARQIPQKRVRRICGA